MQGAKLSRAMCSRARGMERRVRQSWAGGRILCCKAILEMSYSPSHPSLSSAVSSYTNAVAITQFFGVLCAPWNGLLMHCLKQKYQKEARKMGETKASEDQGTRMGEIFIYLHAHLLFCS